MSDKTTVLIVSDARFGCSMRPWTTKKAEIIHDRREPGINRGGGETGIFIKHLKQPLLTKVLYQ